jgi:acyl transferase domain-containing protein/aryl carrier-like protein
MDDDGIAIIGAGCRFAGAPDPAAFWRNLRAGADTLSRFSTDQLLAAGLSPDLVNQPDYIPIRGILPDGELFDWRYFGYSRAEAGLIDPQQRVFLEVCVAALQDAALDPARFPGWIGVYAGCDMTLAPLEPENPAMMSQFIGREKDFLATRVAYKLRLRGPAITVQTACSTSLVAVHQAAQSLRNHECDAALAGGGSLWLPQVCGYLYERGSILSVDGRCRSFDAEATGSVPSNGAGVVVLRRLSDALDDGDRIMAVLRGSALNNDGGEKIGYTAPSLTGQRDVIRLALAQADVDPDDVVHVEAHGTATQVGDPVEVAALTAAYRASTDRVGYCWLSSVKSNIGHTGAAAGVAGLIKTALMLEHRELVPSVHFRRPNPELKLAESPFQVITERQRLDPDRPMLAGVSSFGIGGTNAHAVLEAPPRPSRGSGPAVFCLSATTAGALGRARAELADRITGEDAPDPVAAAWTLVNGRPAFDHRISVVAEDLDQAAAGLLAQDRRPTVIGAEAPKAAFVFPGQGPLFPGAAAAAYEVLPVFREIFDQAVVIARQHWDVDLGIALRPDADPGPLRTALVHQTGLFAIGYGLGRQLLEWGIRPVAMLGQSAGEYVAAALAGVWDLAAGLRVVAERAIAMDNSLTGRMIAVYAPLTEFEALSEGRGLGVATTGPGQVVLSGPAAGIAGLAADLEHREIPHALLDIFVPAHTEGMRPIAGPLRAAVEASAPRVAELPLISNLTGQLIEPGRLLDPGYWTDQLCGQVRLGDGMTTLLAEGCDVVIEVGPGRALTGGLRRHPGWTSSHTAIPLLGRSSEPRRSTLLAALGRLWEAGLPVTWKPLFARRPTPARLPAVPLNSEPCPIPQAQVIAAASRAHVRSPAAVLADALAWPASHQASLSGRPDLVEALDAYSAGLGARFVLDVTGQAAGDRIAREELMARIDPERRLPELADFLTSVMIDDGLLAESGGQLTVAPDIADRVAAALARAADLDELDGVRRLIEHSASSYAGVFAGRVEPMDVLYPAANWEPMTEYMTSNEVAIGDAPPCLDAVTASLSSWFEARGDRPTRVLQVGAGRGLLTWRLLDAWPHHPELTFDVTDPRAILVADLEQTVRQREESSVRPRVFDIRADAITQGLRPESYDLIIGYNAVHVAPSIPRALRNLGQLLRPDGAMCLIELTRTGRWRDFVWGLAPGWWDFDDKSGTGKPVLDVPGWRQAFTAAGFAAIAASQSGESDHTVLMANRTDPVQAVTSPSEPSPAATRVRHAVPPENQALAELWCQSLGVSSVQPQDNYYVLGGESLGLIHLLGRIRALTGVRLTIAEFAEQPTFQALTELASRPLVPA